MSDSVDVHALLSYKYLMQRKIQMTPLPSRGSLEKVVARVLKEKYHDKQPVMMNIEYMQHASGARVTFLLLPMQIFEKLHANNVANVKFYVSDHEDETTIGIYHEPPLDHVMSRNGADISPWVQLQNVR